MCETHFLVALDSLLSFCFQSPVLIYFPTSPRCLVSPFFPVSACPCIPDKLAPTVGGTGRHNRQAPTDRGTSGIWSPDKRSTFGAQGNRQEAIEVGSPRKQTKGVRCPASVDCRKLTPIQARQAPSRGSERSQERPPFGRQAPHPKPKTSPALTLGESELLYSRYIPVPSPNQRRPRKLLRGSIGRRRRTLRGHSGALPSVEHHCEAPLPSAERHCGALPTDCGQTPWRISTSSPRQPQLNSDPGEGER